MKSSLKLQTAVAGTALLVGLGGCADDPNRNAKIGAATGAVVGAVLGHQVDGDKGRYIGAVVGGLAGAGVGHYMDKQRQELERQLAEEERRGMLRISELPDGSLKVGVASDATFDVNKSDIKPGAQQTFAKIATIVGDYNQTILHVVGHADSDGADDYNLALSQRRSSAVANLMVGQGVDPARMRTEGRGEREPIASNETSEGKRRNRRVDIVIKPIVEGREYEATQPPPYLGS